VLRILGDTDSGLVVNVESGRDINGVAKFAQNVALQSLDFRIHLVLCIGFELLKRVKCVALRFRKCTAWSLVQSSRKVIQ
jgi:hypothetical protein